MLLISEIELPEGADAAAFGDFMRDEYLPAVHKGPTRVGQVKKLELLQRATGESRQGFLWLVQWSGLPRTNAITVDDDEVRRKFEAFGATVTEPLVWNEVAQWPGPS